MVAVSTFSLPILFLSPSTGIYSPALCWNGSTQRSPATSNLPNAMINSLPSFSPHHSWSLVPSWNTVFSWHPETHTLPPFPPVSLSTHSQSLFLIPPPLSQLQMLMCLRAGSGPLLSSLHCLSWRLLIQSPSLKYYPYADVTKLKSPAPVSSLRFRIIHQVVYLPSLHGCHTNISNLTWPPPLLKPVPSPIFLSTVNSTTNHSVARDKILESHSFFFLTVIIIYLQRHEVVSIWKNRLSDTTGEYTY